uniref:Conserved hypothetical plastid protein n=1 Tax=Caulacanthus okamurae TaxID=152008 RepID=A0A6H1U7V6_9FLOR|nr:conserved hypothetical plastid protein [Caulacanthus okamurae]QIZ74745.1 conserved hypothetical plastid protein [Caulacanthus okamurae]
MNQIESVNFWKHLQNIIIFFLFIGFTVVLWLIMNFDMNNQTYSIFIEFENAHGIRQGTSLRMRGINVGFVKKIKIDLNSVLVLGSIKSRYILIPKNSIIETNQTGLLNDTVIDIIPLDLINERESKDVNVLSSQCLKSKVVCHLNYLQGERGLNYDDLVRAATRISQRFDDPSFFELLYMFLQNTIELSNDIFSITLDVSNLISIFYSILKKRLESY